jgi:hypothetical protein
MNFVVHELEMVENITISGISMITEFFVAQVT